MGVIALALWIYSCQDAGVKVGLHAQSSFEDTPFSADGRMPMMMLVL
jgi:hypothetical protein